MEEDEPESIKVGRAPLFFSLFLFSLRVLLVAPRGWLTPSPQLISAEGHVFVV